jgi:hypothetical protein
MGISVCLACGIAARGDAGAAKMSYDQAVAALQQLLNGKSIQSDGHTPATVTVLIIADERGAVTITQRADRDRPGWRFKSTTLQTWDLHAGSIDAKRVRPRTEPLSVYVPILKDERRISVIRTESKSRVESGDGPGDDWDESDRFMASFVSIPADTMATAEKAAELIRQISKTSRDTD